MEKPRKTWKEEDTKWITKKRVSLSLKDLEVGRLTRD